MKPSLIFDVLDLAMRVRKEDRIFNPLFIGPAGVGKSQIVQKWANSKNLPFLDLRAAYLEAPDLIGFPSIEKDENNRTRTIHNLPEFWPTEGEGVLLLEEPNRGTSSIMNTMMQILTDRKVHTYTLPKGWIIVGCMNPETEEYEVNSMDTALKDRFEFFNIDYDKTDFINFMQKNEWTKEIIQFVQSGTWQYKEPENMSKTAGSKYISPRTLSKLEAAIKGKIESSTPTISNQDLELIIFRSILGSNIGTIFWQFKNFEKPVTFDELYFDQDTADEEDFMRHKTALRRLKQYSDPKDYKAGIVSLTVNDILENYEKVNDELLILIALTLPADQSCHLIKKIEKLKDKDLLEGLFKKSPSLKEYIKSVLKQVEIKDDEVPF